MELEKFIHSVPLGGTRLSAGAVSIGEFKLNSVKVYDWSAGTERGSKVLFTIHKQGSPESGFKAELSARLLKKRTNGLIEACLEVGQQGIVTERKSLYFICDSIGWGTYGSDGLRHNGYFTLLEQGLNDYTNHIDRGLMVSDEILRLPRGWELPGRGVFVSLINRFNLHSRRSMDMVKIANAKVVMRH